MTTQRRWLFWGCAFVVGVFLITQHSAHVVQYLPWILILACPLMHLLHRHGAHHGDRSADVDASKSSDKGG